MQATVARADNLPQHKSPAVQSRTAPDLPQKKIVARVPGNIQQGRCREYYPLRKPWFGDTHIHTSYSQDASTQDTRSTPFDAYRFAKGESIGLQPYNEQDEAQRAQQISRPLDFAAVTDHAEMFGEVRICNTPGMEGYDNWVCKIYRKWPRVSFYMMNARSSMFASRWGFCGDDNSVCLAAATTVWQDVQAAARQANDDSDACMFTAFNAYEWTGNRGPSGTGNMHRNVIFANDAVPDTPISLIETKTPQNLWRALDTQCTEGIAGCEVVVIPHNSNLSDGQMFNKMNFSGEPVTAEDNRFRAQYERLIEIMQHKGDSECYNAGYGAVARDELCDFEKLSNGQMGGKVEPRADTGFVREILRNGFRQQELTGINPYQFGIVASTDTHLGIAGAVEESRFQGGGGAGIDASNNVPIIPDKPEYNPGGLAVLVAEENSRESLFDAMQRKEAYGTSGPRINLRFFAGWDYPATMCDNESFLSGAYKKGVAMGSELGTPPSPATKPSFAISAMQDGASQPLQRLQIIKGWVDNNGESQERVYEVAGNPNNGASVDTNSCATSGKGFASLCSVWRDPEFDKDINSYYYARVIENPSCRWTQRICAQQKVDCSMPETIGEGLEACCADSHRPVIQERAWSSPIWYSPQG